MKTHCDGCDQQQEGVLPFLSDFEGSGLEYCLYCPDCAAEREAEATAFRPILPRFSLDEIPRSAAQAAHAGSSFVPEKRARQEQVAYVVHLEELRDQLLRYATNEERAKIVAEELERYREGYRKRLLARLGAQSRTMSAMITGPSNFPTRSNQKRLDSERRRRDELLDFTARAQAAIHRKFQKLDGKGPISSDDPDAPEALQKKIAALEAQQEKMKAVNKIARKKSLSDDEKVERLRKEQDLSDASARMLLEPDFAGRVGFASYQLKNNSANIMRVKARLENVERIRRRETQEETLDGEITLVQNVEDNRVQLFFPDRPNADVRTLLKARGFRWAPSVGAWQRHLSDPAVAIARQVADQIAGNSP